MWARTGVRGRTRIGALAGLVALVVSLLACGGGSSGGDADAADAPTPVALEMAGSTGQDPFAESVAITETAEFPDVVAATISDTAETFTADPGTGGVTTTGATPGLYGGSRDDAVCDVEALTAYLTDPAHADKATAFTQTLGITMDDLAGGFLSALTPVLLTTDTLVTNHGFRDGSATAFPAVLQAGTAVLVDAAGVPRVRCSCGNPLDPPPADVDLTEPAGDPWPGFGAATTTTITASATPVATLTVVDTTSGDTFSQPAGAGSAAASVDLQDQAVVILDDAGREVTREAYDAPGDVVVAAITEALGPPDSVVDEPERDVCSPPHRLTSWGGFHVYDQPPIAGGERYLYLYLDEPGVAVTGYGIGLGQPLSDVLGHPDGAPAAYEAAGIDEDGDESGVLFAGPATSIEYISAPDYVGPAEGDC